jgi:hypothetical protein
MDVNAIVDGSGDPKIGAELQRGGELNVKRYARRDLSENAWRGADRKRKIPTGFSTRSR